ncbi:12735_t:CDS:2, partial [Acaulospora colombiana]
MIIQDIQSDNSDRSRNIQETEQSKDSSASFTTTRIDDSDIEMEELGNSSQTRPRSMSIQRYIPDLVFTLNELEDEHSDTYLEEWCK